MGHHGYPSLARIQEHLEELRLQEKDALDLLSRPESKPGMHAQLGALVQRIHDERRGLQRSITDLMASGQLASRSIH